MEMDEGITMVTECATLGAKGLRPWLFVVTLPSPLASSDLRLYNIVP